MQASQNELPVWHGTTILTVRKGGKVVIGGDGQVTLGNIVGGGGLVGGVYWAIYRAAFGAGYPSEK